MAISTVPGPAIMEGLAAASCSSLSRGHSKTSHPRKIGPLPLASPGCMATRIRLVVSEMVVSLFTIHGSNLPFCPPHLYCPLSTSTKLTPQPTLVCNSRRGHFLSAPGLHSGGGTVLVRLNSRFPRDVSPSPSTQAIAFSNIFSRVHLCTSCLGSTYSTVCRDPGR
jgi:hypothetical protein